MKSVGPKAWSSVPIDPRSLPIALKPILFVDD